MKFVTLTRTYLTRATLDNKDRETADGYWNLLDGDTDMVSIAWKYLDISVTYPLLAYANNSKDRVSEQSGGDSQENK